MISSYVFAADDSVVEFFSRCGKREREDLLRLFRSLADFNAKTQRRIYNLEQFKK